MDLLTQQLLGDALREKFYRLPATTTHHEYHGFVSAARELGRPDLAGEMMAHIEKVGVYPELTTSEPPSGNFRNISDIQHELGLPMHGG